MEDKQINKLYDALLSKGYSQNELGDLDSFTSSMSNKESRKTFYDNVAKRGDFRLGPYEDYEKRLSTDFIKVESQISPTDSNYQPVKTPDDFHSNLDARYGKPGEGSGGPEEVLEGFGEIFVQDIYNQAQGIKRLAGGIISKFEPTKQDWIDGENILNSVIGEDGKLDMDKFNEAVNANINANAEKTISEGERKHKDQWGSSMPFKARDYDPRLKVNNQNQLASKPYQILSELIEQTGGNAEEIRNILSENSKELNTGEKWIEQADKAIAESKPVADNRAAFLAHMASTSIGNLAALGLSFVPGAQPIAGAIAGMNMAYLTASEMGSSLAEADLYEKATGKEISDWEKGMAAIGSGAIELISEKIPFDMFFGKIMKTSSKSLFKKAAGMIADSPGASRELSKLLKRAGKDFGRIANLQTLKEIAKGSVTEGLSEAFAEGLQTATPMIYQNPEDFPELGEILSNAWEGAKGGMFMGSFFGGGSNISVNMANNRRRKDQGAIIFANTKNGVVEIINENDGKYSVLTRNGKYETIDQSDVYDSTVISYDDFNDFLKNPTDETAERLNNKLAEDVDSALESEVLQSAGLATGDGENITLLDPRQKVGNVTTNDVTYITTKSNIIENGQQIPQYGFLIRETGGINGQNGMALVLLKGTDGRYTYSELPSDYIDTRSEAKPYKTFLLETKRAVAERQAQQTAQGDVVADNPQQLAEDAIAEEQAIERTEEEIERERTEMMSRMTPEERASYIEQEYQQHLAENPEYEQQVYQSIPMDKKGNIVFDGLTPEQIYIANKMDLSLEEAQEEAVLSRDAAQASYLEAQSTLSDRKKLSKMSNEDRRNLRLSSKQNAQAFEEWNRLLNSIGIHDDVAVYGMEGKPVVEETLFDEVETPAEEINAPVEEVPVSKEINAETNKKNNDNTFIGRALKQDESQEIVSKMEQGAEIMPEIELTPENWINQFGENGTIETPIGSVKMGENQLAKLFLKKRQNEFGMILPTLTSPDVIIEKNSPKEGSERDTKYLFVKTFIKPDGKKVVHYESVTVKKDGLEVSISSHIANGNTIKKEMQNGKILHLNDKLSPSSESYLTETPNKERPDLVPTSDNNISSESKVTEISEQNNTQEENVADSPIASRIKQLAEPLGLSDRIVLVNDVNEISDEGLRNQFTEAHNEGRNTYAAFNRNDGKVYMYMPHLTEEEVEKTFNHEVIAHLGIRELYGDDIDGFNALLDDVWNMMSDENKAKYKEYAVFSEDASEADKQAMIRDAAEEYIAEIAEHPRTNENKGIFKQIADSIRTWLSNHGITRRMTDSDIVNILKRSRENLEARKAQKDAEAVKADIESKLDTMSLKDLNAMNGEQLAQSLAGLVERGRMQVFGKYAMFNNMRISSGKIASYIQSIDPKYNVPEGGGHSVQIMNDFKQILGLNESKTAETAQKTDKNTSKTEENAVTGVSSMMNQEVEISGKKGTVREFLTEYAENSRAIGDKNRLKMLNNISNKAAKARMKEIRDALVTDQQSEELFSTMLGMVDNEIDSKNGVVNENKKKKNTESASVATTTEKLHMELPTRLFHAKEYADARRKFETHTKARNKAELEIKDLNDEVTNLGMELNTAENKEAIREQIREKQDKIKELEGVLQVEQALAEKYTKEHNTAFNSLVDMGYIKNADDKAGAKAFASEWNSSLQAKELKKNRRSKLRMEEDIVQMEDDKMTPIDYIRNSANDIAVGSEKHITLPDGRKVIVKHFSDKVMYKYPDDKSFRTLYEDISGDIDVNTLSDEEKEIYEAKRKKMYELVGVNISTMEEYDDANKRREELARINDPESGYSGEAKKKAVKDNLAIVEKQRAFRKANPDLFKDKDKKGQETDMSRISKDMNSANERRKAEAMQRAKESGEEAVMTQIAVNESENKIKKLKNAIEDLESADKLVGRTRKTVDELEDAIAELRGKDKLTIQEEDDLRRWNEALDAHEKKIENEKTKLEAEELRLLSLKKKLDEVFVQEQMSEPKTHVAPIAHVAETNETPAERQRRLAREAEAAVQEEMRRLGLFRKGPKTMFSENAEEFIAKQKKAVKDNGTVSPNLRHRGVIVTNVDRHDFKGSKPISQAKQWAYDNLVGDHEMSTGDIYTISKNAVDKYLSSTAIKKSDNLGIHLATLKELPNVIDNSIDVEVHADYKKDSNEIRGIENGINSDDILIHRLYGAINIDGTIYRVKTTMQEYMPNSPTKNSPHSYEVTKIEVLEESNTSYGAQGQVRENFTLETAKLLKDVKKSYTDEEILQVSEDIVEDNDKPALFRKDRVSFATRGKKSTISDINELNGAIEKSLPASMRKNTQVLNGSDFERAYEDNIENAQIFTNSNDEIFAFRTDDGKIYINSDNTAIDISLNELGAKKLFKIAQENDMPGIFESIVNVAKSAPQSIKDDVLNNDPGIMEDSAEMYNEIVSHAFGMEQEGLLDDESKAWMSDLRRLAEKAAKWASGNGFIEDWKGSIYTTLHNAGIQDVGNSIMADITDGESALGIPNDDEVVNGNLTAQGERALFRANNKAQRYLDALNSIPDDYKASSASWIKMFKTMGLIDTRRGGKGELVYQILSSRYGLKPIGKRAMRNIIEDTYKMSNPAARRIRKFFGKKNMTDVITYLADSTYTVEQIMNEIAIRGGKVTNATDVYKLINLEASKVVADVQDFKDRFEKSMIRAYGAFSDIDFSNIVPNEYSNSEAVDRYLFALHASERNKKVITDRVFSEIRNKYRRDDDIAMMPDIKEYIDALYENSVNGAPMPANVNAIPKDVRKDINKVVLIDKNSNSGYGEVTFANVSADNNNMSGFELDDNHAKQYINDFESIVRNETGSIDIIDDLTLSVHNATSILVDFARRKGLISEEQSDAYINQYKHYVPLRGWDEEAEMANIRTNQAVTPGLNRAGSMSLELDRIAEGRQTEARSPLASIMQEAQNTFIRGEQNETNMALYNLFRENRDIADDMLYVYEGDSTDDYAPDWAKEISASRNTEEGQKHSVMVRVNGVEKQILLYGKEGEKFAIARNGLAKNYMNWMRKPTKYMSNTMTTFKPMFWATNIERDIRSGLRFLYVDQGFDFAKDAAKNIWSSASEVFDAILGGNESADYMDFKQSGGLISFYEQRDIQSLREKLNKDLEYFENNKEFKKDNIMQLIKSIPNGMEQIMRFTAFKTARQNGMTSQEAAYLAHEVSGNFARKGNQTWLSNSFAFFNPTIQGIYGWVKLAKKNPKRFAAAMTAEVGINTMLMMASMLIFEAMRKAGDDDDEIKFSVKDAFSADNPYFNIPSYIRRNANIIPLGVDEFGVPSVALIQKPHNFRAVSYMSDIVGEYIMGGISGKDAMLEMAKSIVDEISPFGSQPIFGDGGGQKLSAFVPTVFRPIVDVVMNTNAFGSTISNMFGAETEPSYKNSRGGTNKWLVDASRWIEQTIGGGSTGIKGRYKFNAEQVNYLLNSYIGPVNRMFEYVGNELGRNDAEDYRYGSAFGKLFSSMYYENRDKAMYSSTKDLRKMANRYVADLLNNADAYDIKDIVSDKKTMERVKDELTQLAVSLYKKHALTVRSLENAWDLANNTVDDDNYDYRMEQLNNMTKGIARVNMEFAEAFNNYIENLKRENKK